MKQTNFIKIKPEHDTAAGLIHPYWARKPLNIIEEIIKEYSNLNDCVLDPFMGSGTTLFASVKHGRRPVGNDINPIAYHLVSTIFKLSSGSDEYEKLINNTSDALSNYAIELYKTKSGKCVEREYYDVDGEYSSSNFSLVLKSVKLKSIKDGQLKGKIETANSVNYCRTELGSNIDNPINFSKIQFTENTRIAVHFNVTAHDFFTDRNIAFINFFVNIIHKCKSDDEQKVLRLYLSSMLPLLRLSDHKASSQWPYWRPKSRLVSRNPLVALKKRQEAFLECIKWSRATLTHGIPQLYSCPAKDLKRSHTGSVDLIVTDPPYSDHTPYLEYSEFFGTIAFNESFKSLWDKEIVKTNAVGRSADSDEYTQRMGHSFKSILNLLKTGGYFIFFYLDKNIQHWIEIKKSLEASSCFVEDIIPLPKQRRSMKGVVSKGKTLDGDLIVVCRKDKALFKKRNDIPLNDAIQSISGETYFERFSYFIKIIMMNNVQSLDSLNTNDISRMI